MVEWSEKIAQEFIEDVERTLEIIKLYPELYPLSDYLDIRKAVIRPQITLFYKVKDDSIIILRFWNNHKNTDDIGLI